MTKKVIYTQYKCWNIFFHSGFDACFWSTRKQYFYG